MTEPSLPTPDADQPRPTGPEGTTPPPSGEQPATPPPSEPPSTTPSTWARREVGQPSPWTPAGMPPPPPADVPTPPLAAPVAQGWGAPPPAWPWPPSAAPLSPEASSHQRRPVVLLSAGMLAVGLAIGAVGTIVFARSNSPTATLLVNDNPAKQASTGSAVTVAQQLGPAVGTIIAKEPTSNALGSGFVIAHDGSASYLLTNNHVVSGATDLHVVMPGGRNLKASVVGTDAFDDLAVVSVPDASLPVATFGASHLLVVGQSVVAIGSPLGNEGSVTAGVLSALHRTITAGSDVSGQSESLQDVLQTDASINQGNSGGPLADMDGRVVGVNVAIAGGASNIGFSIPADLAQQVAQQLISHQKVQHPYLGISYLTSIEAVEAGQGFDGPGVLVRDVRSGSPADKAGFQKGDILQAVGSTPIDNGATLGGLVQQHKVGDNVDLTVKRGSNVIHLTCALIDRPANP